MRSLHRAKGSKTSGLYAALGLTGSLVLTGCATPSPPPAGSASIPLSVQEAGRVAADEAAAARQAAAAGKLLEAEWHWRLVEATASDPGPAKAQITALQTTIATEVVAAVSKGEAARTAGDNLSAAAAFKRALLLDPKQPAALSYLRETELNSVLRLSARQYSGSTRERRSKSVAPAPAAPRKVAPH